MGAIGERTRNGGIAVDRREFLRTAAAGAVAVGIGGSVLAAPPRGGQGKQQFTAQVGDDASTGMPYIGIPACKIRVSRIMMGPSSDAVLLRQVQYGCNYLHKVDACGSKQFRQNLDWDYFYCDVVIDKLGKDEAIKEFERRRSKAGLDVIHFFKIHATLKRPEDIEKNPQIFEAFETLRDQGKTKWLAISLHAGAEMIRACVESGKFAQIQVMFSPMHASNQALRQALQTAQQRGIGVVAMKTMMGGPRRWQNNPRARQFLQQFAAQGVTPAQAVLKWVLAQPEITAAVPACKNLQQADEACTAAGARLQAWEQEAVERLAEALSPSYCRSCRSCEDVCPMGLPIADIFRYHIYATGYGELHAARRLYSAIPAQRQAQMCNDCGLCEQVCPYGLRVREMLAEAHQTLA